MTGCKNGYDSKTEDMSTTDTTPPTVAGKSPTGENVPVTTEIIITFSEPMNTGSAEKAFSSYPDTSDKFHWKNNRMIHTPDSNLKYDTEYTVHIKDARDLAGNSLHWYEWNFKTESPNNLPSTPKSPSGSVKGYTGESYSHSTYAEYPDRGQIQYILGTVINCDFL